jgi:hypothetical protein
VNINTELDRLFAQELRAIPKPDPLCQQTLVRARSYGDVIYLQAERETSAPIDPVDADEAVHGVCVQGDCDEQ